MPDFTLRRATPADAPALSLVASAAFLETYAGVLPGVDIVAHCSANNAPERFAAWAADAACAVTLAEHPHGAAPLGYALLTSPDFPLRTGPADIELRRIYTLATTHGSGLGQALLAQAIADACARERTRMLLGTHPGNTRARRFYERNGFRVIGERVFQVGAQRLTDPVYALDLQRVDPI